MPGDLQSLALAVEIRADGALIGVLGILVRSKRNGLLPAVAPVIDDLLKKARFRVSDEIIREAFRLAGE